MHLIIFQILQYIYMKITVNYFYEHTKKIQNASIFIFLNISFKNLFFSFNVLEKFKYTEARLFTASFIIFFLLLECYYGVLL